MNRTKKCCVYHDCNTNSLSNPDLTLFQFPKNEERIAKWCELGAVDPFDTRPRFMCELHFPRIYMCFSARRKMLLNTAIPRAFGTNEEDEQDQELVQSSSYEAEDVSIEEHLDENMMDESDELAAEIIYVNRPQSLEHDQDEPTTSRKRSRPIETTPSTKIIKLEKLASTSRSMVVSSSSTKSVDASRNPIALTPPHGTILRRVKLKKRPSATKTIVVKTIEPNAIEQEVAVAAKVAVSSSPEKKASPSDSDAKEEDEWAYPVKTTSAVASSSNSTAVEAVNTTETEKEEKKPQVDKSPPKKEESIYEFIFKGEEYVQMPKAKYYGEREKLEKQVEQSAKAQEQLEKKIEYYRRSLKDLKEFLHNVCEENDYDVD
ncbi:microtubule-associated protein 1B-like [Ochlerotatus camptorhynchus]|uniref:microtubule-associated protein 1B-like n=1 Tax=Ochlerotatus camptorhynchus TaxID=644619 RepID=UPI0031D6B7A9